MPSITTELREYADLGNSRTYTAPTHQAQLPFLVIQKRNTPAAANASAEVSIRVVKGTTDAEGLPLSSKSSFEVIVRHPNSGDIDDRAAVLALAREIIASDEFADAIATLNWVK